MHGICVGEHAVDIVHHIYVLSASHIESPRDLTGTLLELYVLCPL